MAEPRRTVKWDLITGFVEGDFIGNGISHTIDGLHILEGARDKIWRNDDQEWSNR